MTAAEQAHRRQLKAERRELDRMAEAVAREGKAALRIHPPSTRAKQAKWHTALANAIHRQRSAWGWMRDRMAQIRAELERTL